MTPRSWLRLALAAALLAPAAAAEASDPQYSSALCDRAILNGARRGGVPPAVLHAVALTETGRHQDGKLRAWPWAINREGKGYWFGSRDEALAFARESLAEGRPSFDVGCVQINYRWHGHAFPSLEAMFDPEYTATYAAQFLRTLYEERGSWSAAAGAYHSLSPDLAKDYRVRFDRLLASLEPGALTEDETLIAETQPPATSTRQSRREAQRRAMADRILNAAPPPAPLNGSIAGTLLVPAAGALLSAGRPLLSTGSPPLLSAPGRSLF